MIHVPAILVVGLMGLIVEIPLYTVIAVLKSPYMLFKGWHRLLHDLVSREGPFLETACVPIAGLVIIFWPLVVIGSILLSIFASFFVGLYASVIVYQVSHKPTQFQLQHLASSFALNFTSAHDTNNCAGKIIS